MGCFSGCLMTSASDQKLFCEVCSAFGYSFDEFLGERVVSPSCSSTSLAPPPLLFHFHQRLFSSSLLSAMKMVSSAYLRLLIFLLVILIQACASSNLAFHMMFPTILHFPWSSQPRDWTQVSHITGGFFTSWATREGQNTGVSSLSLLQRIFPTQELNWGLLHCRQILYQLSYEGSPSFGLSMVFLW